MFVKDHDIISSSLLLLTSVNLRHSHTSLETRKLLMCFNPRGVPLAFQTRLPTPKRFKVSRRSAPSALTNPPVETRCTQDGRRGGRVKGRVILSRQHSKPAFSDRLSLIPADSGTQAQIQGPRMMGETGGQKQHKQRAIWSRRCPAGLLINTYWHMLSTRSKAIKTFRLLKNEQTNNV